MNSRIESVCHITVAVALAAAAAGIPAHASQAPQISEDARVLVGHWRKTTVVFESPQDEHLVLNANGSAANWVVTASSQSVMTTGRWKVEGKVLTLLFENGKEWSQPFTIYEGQLVFPNVQDRRRFWEKIAR